MVPNYHERLRRILDVIGSHQRRFSAKEQSLTMCPDAPPSTTKVRKSVKVVQIGFDNSRSTSICREKRGCVGTPQRISRVIKHSLRKKTAVNVQQRCMLSLQDLSKVEWRSILTDCTILSQETPSHVNRWRTMFILRTHEDIEMGRERFFANFAVKIKDRLVVRRLGSQCKFCYC